MTFLLHPQGRIAVDRRTGAEESGWAATTSLRQLALDRVCQLERHVGGAVVHIANAGDAVSEEQRKVPVLGRDRPVGCVNPHGIHRVDVHIPQAGDDVAACSVNQLRIAGYPDLVGRAHGRDAIARYKNGLFATEGSIHHIDDGDSSDGHGRGPRPRVADGHRWRPRRACDEQQAGNTQQDLHHLTS